ncbi:MAG: TerB family tellurite resistance protein, partial [Polyangiaceae bacterium]|nr:TerB family tellurite resistance protein [Polyangiaceae bacterium]
MQDFQEAMVKSLVAVAWADGRIDADETEVIEALLSAFEVHGEDADRIREFAKTPKTLDDVPLTELSGHDRRMLVQHAVILTFVDGEQSEDEAALIDELIAKLRIPDEEAKPILE